MVTRSSTYEGAIVFLKSLSLNNVRSFRQIEIDLAPDQRRWTFLLGENGTGKSTILRSIALITAGSDATAEQLHNPDEWVRFGSDVAKIRATLQTAEGEEREVGLDIHRGDTLSAVLSRNESAAKDPDDPNPGLESLDAAVRNSLRSYFVTGFGVSRRASESQVSTKESGGPFRAARARSVATLFSADTRLTSIESWAMDLDYRKGKEGQDLIEKSFEKLLPDVQFEGIDRDERSLMFSTADGTIPYTLLSDGYKNIVGWLGDFLYRLTETFDDYTEPLSSRGLLLLDEVELHLHPKWQRGLVAFLTDRLPNFQIITTTHAPLTAHQAGENELFFVRRDAAGAPQVIQYEGAPNRLMLHQVIRSPMFGLDTLDSQYVSSLRTEYADLKREATLSGSKGERLKEVEERLEDIPNWEDITDAGERERKLLEKIGERLDRLGTGSTRAPARKKAAKEKTPKKKVRRKKTATKKAARKKATRKKATRKKATRKKATRKKATRTKATRKKAAKKKATRKKAARKAGR